MYTLTSFRRRITNRDRQVEVELPAGQVRWLDAQEHAGENIGDTPTRAIFVEFKDAARVERRSSDMIGPAGQ